MSVNCDLMHFSSGKIKFVALLIFYKEMMNKIVSSIDLLSNKMIYSVTVISAIK